MTRDMFVDMRTDFRLRVRETVLGNVSVSEQSVKGPEHSDGFTHILSTLQLWNSKLYLNPIA